VNLGPLRVIPPGKPKSCLAQGQFLPAKNLQSPDLHPVKRRRTFATAERLRGTLEFRTVGPLRARVEKGRLVLDEPTTLPGWTVVDLVADDEGDDLSNEERRALNGAVSTSWRSAEAGSLRVLPFAAGETKRMPHVHASHRARGARGQRPHVVTFPNR